MNHKKIWGLFNLYFSSVAAQAVIWFPNGKDSIRVRILDGKEFIFTYHDENNWRYETVDNFLNHMVKGE